MEMFKKTWRCLTKGAQKGANVLIPKLLLQIKQINIKKGTNKKHNTETAAISCSLLSFISIIIRSSLVLFGEALIHDQKKNNIYLRFLKQLDPFSVSSGAFTNLTCECCSSNLDFFPRILVGSRPFWR